MKNFKNTMNTLYETILDGTDIHDTIKLSPEQINYLLEIYKDPNYIIGFHNTTNSIPEAFFKDGLFCQNSMGQNTNDLSNTVYWSDMLFPLLLYPSGGKNNNNMCTILRFPKDVFAQDKSNRIGIFDVTDNGRYTINPKYIISAFTDGKIINNPDYDGNYRSNNAIKIADDNIQAFNQDRALNIKFFKEYFYGKENNIFQKIKNKVLSFFGKKDKTKLIPESFAEKNTENLHDQFVSKYAANNSVNSNEIKSRQPVASKNSINRDLDEDSHEL